MGEEGGAPQQGPPVFSHTHIAHIPGFGYTCMAEVLTMPTTLDPRVVRAIGECWNEEVVAVSAFVGSRGAAGEGFELIKELDITYKILLTSCHRIQ